LIPALAAGNQLMKTLPQPVQDCINKISTQAIQGALVNQLQGAAKSILGNSAPTLVRCPGVFECKGDSPYWKETSHLVGTFIIPYNFPFTTETDISQCMTGILNICKAANSLFGPGSLNTITNAIAQNGACGANSGTASGGGLLGGGSGSSSSGSSSSGSNPLSGLLGGGSSSSSSGSSSSTNTNTGSSSSSSGSNPLGNLLGGGTKNGDPNAASVSANTNTNVNTNSGNSGSNSGGSNPLAGLLNRGNGNNGNGNNGGGSNSGGSNSGGSNSGSNPLTGLLQGGSVNSASGSSSDWDRQRGN